jgi:hypothetical protein
MSIYKSVFIAVAKQYSTYCQLIATIFIQLLIVIGENLKRVDIKRKKHIIVMSKTKAYNDGLVKGFFGIRLHFFLIYTIIFQRHNHSALVSWLA